MRFSFLSRLSRFLLRRALKARLPTVRSKPNVEPVNVPRKLALADGSCPNQFRKLIPHFGAFPLDGSLYA